jgi:sugar phosphate isomerase/epimerase
MREQLPLGVGMIQQWLKKTEPGDFLDLLKTSGVDFVEMYLSLEKWQSRAEWLELFIERDLAFTFHGPYMGDYEIAHFENTRDNVTRSLYAEALDRAASVVRRTGARSRVNLHGASSETEPKDILIERSITFLRWVICERDERQWPFDFVLELLPVNIVKPKAGDLVPELLTIEREVGSGLAGFCMDIGHHRANEMLGYDASLGGEFLKKVRHLHIHDMCEGNPEVDHCPLNYGAVDYRHYLEMVKGQDLKLVLELNYTNTSLCGDPVTELLWSVEKLQRAREELLIPLSEE